MSCTSRPSTRGLGPSCREAHKDSTSTTIGRGRGARRGASYSAATDTASDSTDPVYHSGTRWRQHSARCARLALPGSKSCRRVHQPGKKSAVQSPTAASDGSCRHSMPSRSRRVAPTPACGQRDLCRSPFARIRDSRRAHDRNGRAYGAAFVFLVSAQIPQTHRA